MFASAKLVAFGATTDGTRAVNFYGTVLGLPIRSDDPFAIVFDAGGVELRLQKVEHLAPHPFTSLGWEVPDISQVLTDLARANVQPERYAWMEQDAAGIWLAPSGARVAWFKDPDGTLLSVAQYPTG
ncbi:MAG TPA: VOC family protein [Gemmatimonadaceae bacterium]|jgi:predicted enzyme related to lactoylglutathione lyase